MIRRRAGIVAQARQREIDAAGVEMRKRIVFGGMEQAIRGFIANLRQLGGGKIARQAGAHRAIERQGGAIDHIRIRDLMLRQPDADMRAVILIQRW
jgi:hypothetical protein